MSVSDPTVSHGVELIQTRTVNLRQQLLNHEVYEHLNTVSALRCFMEHHVFAVFDFMSLLKSLQRRLTSVSVPWVPPSHSLGARLINEIVLGEESDEDGTGRYASHFELYRQSMIEIGARTDVIDRFVDDLRQGHSWTQALQRPEIPQGVRSFVSATFAVIDANDLIALTANFTFGREDLLPAVFHQIVNELDESSGCLSRFQYYLQRHIDVDGDHHGPLAHRLIAILCGDQPQAWEKAAQASIAALEARVQLWDCIAEAIRRLPRQHQ
ncbi:MAG: DUF3050 domain-containing protein [Planctomycetaceae bacterium]|nr:DUF3050 domain-containing protein [Planctomycetaceae bacterium]